MITSDFVEDNEQPGEPTPEVPTTGVDIDPRLVRPELQQNVQFTLPVFEEGTITGGETISLPADFDDAANKQLQSAPNLNYSLDQQSRNWAANILKGMQNTPGDLAALRTLGKTDRSYSQTIERNGVVLQPKYQKFKPGNSGVMEGDSAIMRLASHRKLGTICKIPLYNTGIWITLRSPSEPSILDLFKNITQDKTDLGRRSYGLSFSSVTTIFTDNVVSFALEQLYSTNLKLEPGVDLKEIISCNDIPAICLGLAAVIWPNGFNYSRSCIADPASCRHVSSGKVNITNMLIVDNTVLTDWQITHMSKTSNNTVSLSDVKRYKDELVDRQNKVVTIDENQLKATSVTYRVPDISQYLQDGYRWINELAQMAEKALTKDATNGSRGEYVTQQGLASVLRQYSHWVEEINYGDAIKDRETIDTSLTWLSSDDDFRTPFLKETEKFIGHSSITAIGIPVYTCPSCKRINKVDGVTDRFSEAIPIDVYQVFFHLVEQRIQKITNR